MLICLFVFLCNTLKAQNQSDSIVVSTEGVSVGAILKADIVKNPYIICSEKDIKIIKYSLSFHDFTGNLIQFNEEGNKLSDLIIREIQALDSGELLSIKVNAVNKKNGKTYDLFTRLTLMN